VSQALTLKSQSLATLHRVINVEIPHADNVLVDV
jgi:hypothetical protein